MNTTGIIYTFSFLMFILVMFAFEFSEYDAFAKDQPSPLAGMNFSKPRRRIQQRRCFANYTRCRLQDR